jgi:membrane-anchored protein YejM (alkaline phosphatase superfamily)
MNVVLLVVDSLRAGALSAARTPFLERLGRETIHFRHAYATRSGRAAGW